MGQFAALFSRLAAQAILVVVVLGGLLVWAMDHGYRASAAQRDRARLEAFADMAGAAVASGASLPVLVQALDPANPESLGGRLVVEGADGAAIGSAAMPPARALYTRPIEVDGRAVATAKLVKPAPLGGAERIALRDQYLGLVLALSVALLMLLIGAYMLAARTARPQIALYRASRDVAQGEYELEFDEAGPSEIAGAMRNLGRIARQFDRLETARRTWLVSVAEELRAPTAAIAKRVAALHRLDPPIDDDFLEAFETEREQLERVADDLHAVALADLGRLPVHFEEVDPRALIHNAVWTNRKRAEPGGVVIETANLPGYTVLVKWDAQRIEQLFGTLIDSSLRYTPSGGRIVLGLESHNGAWRLTVDDSAPGVDVGLAQQLFEPFYRSPTHRDEPITSSGLGLATARAIVEAHHGRIEAGQSPLGGLRVMVTLPSAPPNV